MRPAEFERQYRRGLGVATVSPELNAAALGLVNYLAANGCTQASFTACSTFQAAYNGSGFPGQLSIDGQYGGNTMRALQNVLDSGQVDGGSGPTMTAPADCFQGNPTYGPEAVTPGLDVTPPTPAPTNTTSVVVNNPPPPKPTNWLIWGAVLAGGGAVGYAYWKKHRRGRR